MIPPVQFGAIRTLSQQYQEATAKRPIGTVSAKIHLTKRDALLFNEVSVPSSNGSRVAEVTVFLDQNHRGSFLHWRNPNGTQTTPFVAGLETEEQAADMLNLLRKAPLPRKIRRALLDGTFEAIMEKGFLGTGPL